MASSYYKFLITRTEKYETEVLVKAESREEALATIQEREEDNEYADTYDCPSEVKTKFTCLEGDSDGLSEFVKDTLKVLAAKIANENADYFEVEDHLSKEEASYLRFVLNNTHEVLVLPSSGVVLRGRLREKRLAAMS